MTAALWVIAAGILALVAIIAAASWSYLFGDGQSRLGELTEADVAALLAPHAEITLMATEDAPAPDSVWNGHEE
jgi:hypothetical protein